MGLVKILETTTENPITLIGERAGICWGTDISDPVKNYKRGIQVLNDGHGRPLEFVNIEMVLDGYSARVIREWYTHIGGAPTRLQESTRYLNFDQGFGYVTPYMILGSGTEALDIYKKTMSDIAESYKKLVDECKISKEDAAMILPLGMKTKIVDKRNLRNFIDICHQRLCNRAYWEFQDLVIDIINALRDYGTEWEELAESFLVPKCEFYGYCTEHSSCGHIDHYKNGEYDE